MVHSAFRAIAAVSVLLLTSPSVSAQNSPPTHSSKPKIVGPAPWKPSAQEVSAAYWTLEPGWNTTLEMRNNLQIHDLTVTPVLRNASGQETPLTPVTIPSQHIVSVDLRNSAQSAGMLNQIGSFGSVAFRFNGLDAANLFAATIVRLEGQPIDFHFDADDAGPDYKSGGVEGIWWLPAASSTDYLILGNPSKKAVNGTLTLSESSAASQRVALKIGPGETKRIDLRQVLGPAASGLVGGLSLSLPGKELLSATQFVFDEVTGLAAVMKLFARDPVEMAENRVLLAPMMALSQPDPGLAFPAGTTLIPRIFLRNAGSGPAKVSAAIDWRSEVASGSFAISSMSLAQGEVKILNLADYQNAGQMPPKANWGTVKLAYTGGRADLVAVAVSYDKDSRYGLQTPFSEALARAWAGSMWHVDATHNTLITTGNGGSQNATTEMTLFYNGGKSKYRIKKMLSPGQQLWVDVGQLIRDQVPDSDGATLPAGIMSGSYELRDLDHDNIALLYEGKLVIDKTYGHAAYGCGTCCGNGIPVFDPITFGGPPGIDNPETIHSTEQCGGLVDDMTDEAYNWNSSNTAVATLPNSTLHTVAVGTTSGNTTLYLLGTHPAPSCPDYYGHPQQQVAVVSVNCSPSSLTRGSMTTCTATGPTGSTFSNWKFSDGINNPVTSSSTNSTWSGTMVTGGTVSVTVTSGEGSATPTSTVTVTARSGWASSFATMTAGYQNSPYLCKDGTTQLAQNFSSPPQNVVGGLGRGCLVLNWVGNQATISGGPNDGYQYLTSASIDTPNSEYSWSENPDLVNSSSTFSQAQCGNYNAQTNTGYISWSDLKSGTDRHEAGTVNSHWAEYNAANNGPDNLGPVAEQQVGAPGTNFPQQVNTAMTNVGSALKSAVQVEPCAVNYDATCTVNKGYVNWSPYQVCQ